MYRKLFKRTLDLLLAVLLFTILLPLLVVGILLAWLDTRQNPFFLHLRPGYLGNPIHVIKLRTMGPEFTRDGRRRSNMERQSTLGKWLRRWSIDEVPQLLNVIAGQLSLVGPRPLEMRYLAHYSPAQARRHEVLPGITGLAQVNGRNALTWEQKFELDVFYADNIGFLLDLRILCLTLVQVFSREGINATSHTTMDPFV